MSTLQKQPQWNKTDEGLSSKYEKCRHIAEEIYKRINITFQIKKLEAGAISEGSNFSDQIDSNELSNETDLFACDKSSLSSSTELEALQRGSEACEKFVNNNNNEEAKIKPTIVYKRPRKRFRKRVKKQQKQKRDSDGSSDEALPLTNVADLEERTRSDRAPPSPAHTVMGVPYVVIKPCDLKPKFKTPSPEKKVTKKADKPSPKQKSDNLKIIDKSKATLCEKVQSEQEKSGSQESWSCTLCSLTFRGERGLRRHMTMSHIIDEKTKAGKPNN
ncbi:uncharacterized protein LOC121736478 [Aricia agestis]|uniref:uncharacterized protein LOC121736478 n=1 Tax=Aricia agestis TaxID=91739 RepID=UPI001C20B698|nr:uncharacterized protein LOC121736478 [Aricia agestis]